MHKPECNLETGKTLKRPAHVLPIIIISQFSGTSLWFAGNAIVADLQQAWSLSGQSVGYITSAVLLGFIVGTLVFAALGVADRFSPRWVFFWCSIAGAFFNILVLAAPHSLPGLLALRFATGIFLAGIYPVGMKIAAGWYEKGLGRALGYFVGAIVLGTAFPHLLRSMGAELPWQLVTIATSTLAICGAVLLLLFVPDGPYLPTRSSFNPRALTIIFRSRSFRASAFGYFGHMWELYALWAFIPVWLLAYSDSTDSVLSVPFWTFVIIAMGFIGCVGGGLVSEKVGSARVAAAQLIISGICCVLSPMLFSANPTVFIMFLLVWGVTVVGDSPQFSALNAENAPPEYIGSALTIVNSIGFLISVISIHVVNSLLPGFGPQFIFWLLIPGPLFGLLALKPLYQSKIV